ncbi:MAG TPA: CorA family divalent cation transporter, partial [Gemmatimonadales bacterium]|nr:CorA family divalent cation transporter [Gemmatimonadales bacterium]
MTSIRRQLSVSASRLLLHPKRHPPAGSRPGTLVTSPESPPPVIHLFHYDERSLEERDVTNVEDLAALPQEGVSWVDIQGMGDEALLRRVGQIFQLHPLALEDAVNIPQRPKSELYDHFYLYVTRMIRLGERRELCGEQVSFFFGKWFVLTIQEQYGDVFDPIRKRIRMDEGIIRRQGPDYLAYALIDTVLDGYYPVIETIGDRLHDLEEEILERPSQRGLHRIHRVRRDLLGLRRAVWPQREAVNAMIRDESGLVSPLV